jgi:hypothetical protein
MAAEIFKLFGTIAVNGLEGVKTKLKDLDKQVASMDKALTKFGRQSVKVGTSFSKSFSAPIAAAGAGIIALAVKTGEFSSEILKLEATTGLTTDTLQQFRAVAKATDVSFEGLVGSVVKLTGKMGGIIDEGGNAFEAFKSLGISVKDSSGHIRDMNELFPETIRALQAMDNPAERNAFAVQIFGKSLKDLAPVLGMSTDKFDAIFEASKKGIISRDGLVTAQEFKIQIAAVQGKIISMWRSVAIDLIPVLRDVLFPIIQQKIIPGIQAMASALRDGVAWFKSLDASTRNIIIGTASFIAVLGPAILIMGKTILVIKEIATAYILAKTASMDLAAAMVANPFTLWITGAALLGSGLALLVGEMNRVKAAAVDASKVEGLKKGIEGLNKEFKTFGFLNIAGAQAATDNSTAISDLAGLARELGFSFNEANGSEAEQLQKLGEILKATNSLAEATDKFNKIKAAGKAKPRAGGAGSADEDAIKRRQKLESEYADQRASVELDELAQLDRKYKLELAAAQAAGASTVDLTAAYYMQREEIISSSLEKSLAMVEETVKKENDARDAINEDFKQKLLQQTGDQVRILEAEKAEAIRIAKSKGADVAAVEKYYINEIQAAKDEAAEKDKDRTSGIISNTVNALAALGQGISDIFMMATDNKMLALDNWEKSERQAIEDSIGSEAVKKQKFEELDKAAADKRTELQRQAAKENKAAAIFDSIIGTAQAVVQALSLPVPFNFIMAGSIGAMGAAKTAMIMAQPLPMAEGGIVEGGQGGIQALVGEGRESELVLPMETGVAMLARNLRDSFSGMLPAMTPAAAGAGAAGAIHFHIGTLIADDRGIKELERRQLQFRISEEQRKGNK